jgi:DNA polymerase-3 subunit alpha
MAQGPEKGVSAEVAEKIFDEIEYFAAYGFNKCVTYNTEIVDAETGRLVRVGDLVTGKAHLTQTITCNTDRLRLQAGEVTDVWANGAKPVYRLTTNLGHQIEATANHPFYTFSGWKTLGELAIGDKVAVPRRIPVEGKKEWADHEVIVLGHLLAEGNLCHPSGVYYYTGDPEQWQDYTANLNKFDNTVANTHQRRGMYDVYGKRIRRSEPNTAFAWIDQLGLRNATSYTKFIPDEVFELTNRQIALLIARMWEGDGNIDEKGRYIYYATSSERMGRQLQHLLLRFGIISRIRRVEFAYRDGRIGYQIHIVGNENLRLFRDAIATHFVSLARREKLARMVLEAPGSMATKDSVPLAVRDVVRQHKTARNITWDAVAVGAGVSITEFQKPSNKAKSGFTRAVIGRLAEFFDSDEPRVYSDNDIYWDQIVSIDYIGEQPTYDITVPGTHNFVANDIIVHNSHAADYAVLTCQTAYLKAHYPEEYYTALLSVQRSVIEDVRLFTADCRRFGISVLPPNISYSDLDFTIEPIAKNNKRGIRYGLAAVKNAGEKAVQQIIEARNKGGSFKDISDFCRRVDLRQVGKRAIESLIKIGAFDELAGRDELLLSLDRMMKFSADHHHASDIGQMSLFGGGDVSAGDALTLSHVPVEKQTPSREKLRWEKELVGLYVSEHPLNALVDKIKHLPNLKFSEALRREGEQVNGRSVAIAGLVVAIRPITTKKGDTMAVVTIEDLQGNIDCVLFPRTWSDYQKFVGENRLVIIRGKADTSRGDIQIIVDNVSQNFDIVISADAAPDEEDPWWTPPSTTPEWAVTSEESQSTDSVDVSEEQALDSRDPEEEIKESPLPEPVPVFAGEPVAESIAVEQYQSIITHIAAAPIYEDAPQDDDAPPCRITITIYRSADPNKDLRRINRVQDKLLEYPGHDQFRFRLVDSVKTVMIDFPNHSTRYDGPVEEFLLREFDASAIEIELLDL